MKVILSRKGFDTESGGFPSPIIDNQLISLPIPETDSNMYYRKLNFDSHHNYLDVLLDLKKNFKEREAHLDPDIRKSVINRENGWKGTFGQSKASGAALRAIEEGDLFLFFGLFKRVCNVNKRFQYVNDDKIHKNGQHVIYGYLQVGEKIDLSLSTNKIPLWATNHPHIRNKSKYGKHNTLFIARDTLSFDKSRQGWGCFKYHESLRLTKESETKSVWMIPKFFENEEGNFSKSFHLQNKEILNDKFILMQRRGQSQEVLISENNTVVTWAKDLVKKCPLDE